MDLGVHSNKKGLLVQFVTMVTIIIICKGMVCDYKLRPKHASLCDLPTAAYSGKPITPYLN